jgi:hypothetical protein
VGTVIDHCEQVLEPLVLVFARAFVFASSSVCRPLRPLARRPVGVRAALPC